MRIVLDTNVLVSGVFFVGPPHRILKAWQRGKFTLLLSADILAEYHRVAEELAKRYPGVDLTRLLELLMFHAEMIEVLDLPDDACRDPDDVKFIACALAGKAVCLVSGDHDLLDASGYKGVEVLTPRQFVERFLTAHAS